MLGTFRYLLALTVAIAHLWAQADPWAAHYAVFAFYTISGYLMTLILSEVYPYTREGLGRFCLNRFLRLYPGYWAVCLVTLLLAHVASPEAVNVSNGLLTPPRSVGDWLANLTMFGLTQWRPDGLNTVMKSRLISNAWSINIELWFYLLMAAGLMRRAWLVAVWVLAGVWHVHYGFTHGFGWNDRYSSVLAGLLPFGVGSMLYYVVRRWCMPRWLLVPWCAASAGLLISLVLISRDDEGGLVDGHTEGLYISLVFSTMLIFGLLHLSSVSSERAKAADQWLGRLSYPIFLCHYMVGILMTWAFPTLSKLDGSLFLASLPLIHLTAWGMVVTIDSRVERWRVRVRPRTIPERSSRNERQWSAVPA